MSFSKTIFFILLCFAAVSCSVTEDETPAPFRIIGYYAGPPEGVDSIAVEKLTHLIYCFGHLEGNRLKINSAADTMVIQKMIALKSRNPELKVLLSLGGWGGCEPCSDVFNTATGRREFAESVKAISAYFTSDGIDLDWEYPAIPGPPGHPYRTDDRDNFTELVKTLRDVNGEDFVISFAAGGFATFIESSIDWKQVIRYTDFINVMTYDLVHGYSTTSGHHTPLYSTPQQAVSTDTAVQQLLHAGVPAAQIIIGAAFYGRFFKINEGSPVDLYMPGYFLHGFSFKHADDSLSAVAGFEKRWDDIAQAPYAINIARRIQATYDDERSIALKTRYAIDNKLGGIMFWQLVDDKTTGGLLDVIYKNANQE